MFSPPATRIHYICHLIPLICKLHCNCSSFCIDIDQFSLQRYCVFKKERKILVQYWEYHVDGAIWVELFCEASVLLLVMHSLAK